MTDGSPAKAIQAVEAIIRTESSLWQGDRATAAFLRGWIARFPDSAALRGRLLLRKRQMGDWSEESFDPPISAERIYRASRPMAVLYLTDDPSIHRACVERRVATLSDCTPFRHRRPLPKARLRIGYISANFNNHVTCRAIIAVLEGHDRAAFEITGYSIAPGDGSELRRRVEASVDRFVDLVDLSDAEAARRIHEDEIDILVDLTGYTRDAHPEILKHRPAPVQVNFLGFPGSMAADFVDYIIGDGIIFGDGAAAHFSECLVELPDCYHSIDWQAPFPDVPPPRRELGLPEQGFVFCSFNKTIKISPETFDCWMRLLAQIDGSVLWLLDEIGVQDNLRREAERRGVAGDRLVFAPSVPQAAHLSRIAQADLALDTMPYGSHTTASDALRAGTPVLTTLGPCFSGRVAASMLTAVGVPELVTRDREDYEALALRLARDGKARAALRARLIAHRRTASYFDGAAYIRHLETAFRTMWAIHCETGEPRSFAVRDQGSGKGSGSSTGDPNRSI